MDILDFIYNIVNNENLYNSNLKYCLINKNKIPYKINNELAKPNCESDFIELDELINAPDLLNYSGVGISIQASNIYAIDIDKCFSIPFDINSADDRALDILNLFKNIFYIEFSFSGTGLRILFKLNKDIILDNYKKRFYTKNSKTKCEFYQPLDSYRYVTVTGKFIFNNPLTIEVNKNFMDTLAQFLGKYMMKTDPIVENDPECLKNENFEISEKKLKHYLLVNSDFQELWFSQAPGSGKDESERDYRIIKFIFLNITINKEVIKKLFESSPYFNSKDKKHVSKWNYQNFRYYNYVYSQIERGN